MANHSNFESIVLPLTNSSLSNCRDSCLEKYDDLPSSKLERSSQKTEGSLVVLSLSLGDMYSIRFLK